MELLPLFQSPRSGKFESNDRVKVNELVKKYKGFNPLDRGNLNQMLSQMLRLLIFFQAFQSPRSGKFESNLEIKLN